VCVCVRTCLRGGCASASISVHAARTCCCCRRCWDWHGRPADVTSTHITLPPAYKHCSHSRYCHMPLTAASLVLFSSLAVLDPRVGHTMDVLSPFIPALCHSDWLFHRQSCPRLDVVHPGRAWSSSPALYLALSLSPGNSFVSSWCDHSMLASLLWRCLTVLSLLQLC